MIRVLVVEDEPLIAEAHREYVGRVDGFEVVGVAHTGSDAVRAVASAARVGTPVDLVLLDIGLPDTSGLEVAARLSAGRPSPDIIAVTSNRDLEVVRTAVARGVVLYLLKPFTFAALQDKLEQYVAYRSALRDAETAAGQHDIDRAMSALRTSSSRPSTPKGISPDTLSKITDFLHHADGPRTAAEVGSAVGVSRVTAWRYLERLADDGAATRLTEYGRAGRPQVRYELRR
ncbi:regulator relate [Rhodococcus gordoniae]|uniref:Transcriptional regulatory protein n=1 Tax=Rhodococcus gordoniae TaxID=223392 RepID=A0A379M3H0_9NOCA|nr:MULTISPECIES: response regulator [Rhodococcus]UTT49243.1 response regulator [Rhodococcus gordoniae]SUE16662.1 regulator relate [Rhodococcus gordoniae]